MKIKDLLLLVEGFEKTNERLEKLESLIKRINVTVFKCTDCASITLLGTCSDKACEDRSNWNKEDKPTIADPHEHIWLTDGGCARFLCTLTKKEFDEKTKPKDSPKPPENSKCWGCKHNPYAYGDKDNYQPTNCEDCNIDPVAKENYCPENPCDEKPFGFDWKLGYKKLEKEIERLKSELDLILEGKP